MVNANAIEALILISHTFGIFSPLRPFFQPDSYSQTNYTIDYILRQDYQVERKLESGKIRHDYYRTKPPCRQINQQIRDCFQPVRVGQFSSEIHHNNGNIKLRYENQMGDLNINSGRIYCLRQYFEKRFVLGRR